MASMVLRLAVLGALTLAFAARGESFASSASSAGSASSGSVSDSIKGSSNSSAGDRKVTEGDYRIIEIDQRDAMLHLKLERSAQETFTLVVPRDNAAARGFAVGDVVNARHRPYGVEFARAGEPFFLALADDWKRELAPRAVDKL